MLLFLVLLLLAGTRFEIGNDWGEYTYVMNNIPSFFSQANLDGFRMEFGYLFLNRSLKTLGGNVNTLFFVTTFFSLLVMFSYIFKYSPLPFFSLMIYMRYLYLQSNMMFLRQSIVIGIFLLSINLILERKLLAYIAAVVVAMLFHLSAIILFPIYFLYHVRPSRGAILAATVIALVFTQIRWLEQVASFIPIPQIKLIVLSYLSNDRWSVPVGLSFSVIERFVVFGVLLYYRERLNELFPKKFNLFYNMFLVGFFISLIFYQYNVFLERFILYFNTANVILLAYCAYVFKKSSRVFFILGIALFCTFWFVRYINSPNSVYIPYNSFLYPQL